MSRGSGTAGRAGPLIRRAIGDDAGRLSDLALRSKAVWGYDAAFMDACRAELTISAESIRQRLTFLLEDRGRLSGFYQLRLSGPSAEVAQFFIAPEEIRSGLGRRLWRHLERTARNAGANWLEVDSDPNAEGFYLAMGMERHGERHRAASQGACCRTRSRRSPQRSRSAPPWQVAISRASDGPASSRAQLRLTHNRRHRAMLKHSNPSTVAPPFSRYSHGVEAAASARWLHISGQVGVTPEGKVADGAEAQIEQAWRNVLNVLEAAGMGPRDLVKVTTFLINRADLPTARAVRDRMLQGAAPASTLLFVAGLASPDWLVEIEATAAAD